MADRKRTFQVPHSGEKHQRCFGNSETDFELVQSMLRAVKQSCELLQVSPLLKIHFQRGGEGVAECDRDSAETCFTEIVTTIPFEPLAPLRYNQSYIGDWPSGKATGSGPVIGGSNPSSPAKLVLTILTKPRPLS